MFPQLIFQYLSCQILNSEGEPVKGRSTSWEIPHCRTLFLATSHISQVLSLKTCAAMAYSSIRGSLGYLFKWGQKKKKKKGRKRNALKEITHILHKKNNEISWFDFKILGGKQHFSKIILVLLKIPYVYLGEVELHRVICRQWDH